VVSPLTVFAKGALDEALIQSQTLIPPELPSLDPAKQELLPQNFERQSPRFTRATAAGIILLAFTGVLALLVISFRREAGETLIRLGESLSGEHRSTVVLPQTASPAPAPASDKAAGAVQAQASDNTTASQPQDSASVSSKQAVDAAPANTATPSAPPPVVPPLQEIPAPLDGGSGQKEFDQARAILKGNHRQRDIYLAVNLLWTGVRKGHVPAEVTLADLYARGDGVAQSCAQAHVLLEAAVQKGSPEGRRRLELLKRQGCP
jgi:hypothetical protein